MYRPGMMLSLGMLFLGARLALAQPYYVAPSGSDSNPGTLSQPWATLTKARDVVRTVTSGMSADVTIYLRGGTYLLSSPLTLSSADAGLNGFFVRWAAYPGERPLLSGGTTITGWTLADAGNNIWSASVGSLETRQLFVNGVRGQRARGPSDPSGWVKIAGGFDTTDTTMASWGNVTDIELVGFNDWKLFRCKASAIAANGNVTLVNPCWNNSQFTASWKWDAVKWVENAYELLDTAGEWYLNRTTDTLYYKPRTGEDLATATVVAPNTEGLIQGTGVHHVAFSGITFAYSAWKNPSTTDGYVTLQNGEHFRTASTLLFNVPGTVTFQSSHDLVFDRNVFTKSGDAGLVIQGGSQSATITCNKFDDVGAGGIVLGNVDDNAQTNASLQNRVFTVQNNYLTTLGQDYFDGAGVFGGYIKTATITHNEIRDLGQSPIAVGWGWGTDSYAQDNVFSYNYLHDYTQVLRDSAGIYTLSSQPNTEIHHNYIDHGVLDFGCLYPDEGSANMNWHHNVCERVNQWLHLWTTSIHDNLVQNNYADTTSQINNGTNNTVNSNTFYTPTANRPQAAIDIIATAGIEATCQDIKTLAALPANETAPIIRQIIR